jgi:NAD kinase
MVLKFGIFVHPERPKIAIEQIKKKLQSVGVRYSFRDPDIAVVVGGDGTFGYYGRTLDMPLVFVGVREPKMLGSRARLAEVMFDKLEEALLAIEDGKYRVAERSMIRVGLNGKQEQDVLTDVYLERGIFSGCIRYSVTISRSKYFDFKDYAIGNGVIVSTAFGSGGYYSYPYRLRDKKIRNSQEEFSDNRIGVCHILPTYLVREENVNNSGDHDKKQKSMKRVSYTVPFQAVIQINLVRNVDARLYGTTSHSRGIRVRYNDTIEIRDSTRKAKVVRLTQKERFDT